MSGYVLRRVDGAYVAPSGHGSSYTNDLAKARIFSSKEAAEVERCKGNETVRSVESCLGGKS